MYTTDNHLFCFIDGVVVVAAAENTECVVVK